MSAAIVDFLVSSCSRLDPQPTAITAITKPKIVTVKRISILLPARRAREQEVEQLAGLAAPASAVQYDFAKNTRFTEGLPVKMQVPASAAPSSGIQRGVTLRRASDSCSIAASFQ